MKRILSVILCLSGVFSILTPISYANYINQYYEEVISSIQPPPGVVLNEGEIWIPATQEEILASSIMPFGYEDECGHVSPYGYTLQGRVLGDTDAEITGTNIALGLCSLWIGGPFGIFLTFGVMAIDVLYCVNPGDQLKGPYTRYVYFNGSNHWYHDCFTFYKRDGTYMGSDCDAHYQYT